MLAVGPGPCRNILIAYNLYYIRVNIISRDEKVNLKYNFSQKNFLSEKIGRAVDGAGGGENLLYDGQHHSTEERWMFHCSDERKYYYNLSLNHQTYSIFLPLPLSRLSPPYQNDAFIWCHPFVSVILLFLSRHRIKHHPRNPPHSWTGILLDLKSNFTKLFSVRRSLHYYETNMISISNVWAMILLYPISLAYFAESLPNHIQIEHILLNKGWHWSTNKYKLMNYLFSALEQLQYLSWVAQPLCNVAVMCQVFLFACIQCSKNV